MTYREFLRRVIDDGIDAAERDYAEDEAKRKGAVAGFEACRDKLPVELEQLLREANAEERKVMVTHSKSPERNEDRIWSLKTRRAEIEWVCNCVSALLMNEGSTKLIVQPTARAVMHVARIVGTTDENGVETDATG